MKITKFKKESYIKVNKKSYTVEYEYIDTEDSLCVPVKNITILSVVYRQNLTKEYPELEILEKLKIMIDDTLITAYSYDDVDFDEKN